MSFNVTVASYSRLHMAEYVFAMIISPPSSYKEFPDYIQDFTLHTLSHRLPGRLRTT